MTNPSIAGRRMNLKPPRRGATAVEMAIVGPLVLMVMLATVDLGIAVYSYTNLAESVRAGARYAAVHGSTATTKVGPTANNQNVENVVRSYNAGIRTASLTVTSTWIDGNNSPGSRVIVAANYDYPVVWFLGQGTLKLNVVSTMTIIH